MPKYHTLVKWYYAHHFHTTIYTKWGFAQGVHCFVLFCFAFAYVIYVFYTAIQYHASNEHWTVFALMRFDDIIPNPIFKYTKTMKCIASRTRNRQWLIYFMERQKWQLKVEYMYIVCVKRTRECMYVAKKKGKREKTHGKQPPICIHVNNCI